MSRATRSGSTSSSPARVVSSRCGQAARSSTAARGRLVSRPAVAGELLSAGWGRRSSRPNPSSARISPTLVRLSGVTLGGQPRGDLIGGQPLAAQLNHPAADALLGGGDTRWWAGLAGWGEQLQPSGAPLADQVDHRPAGVAEPVGGLLVAQPVDEEGAQRLVAAVVDLYRRGEPLGPVTLWWSGCHTVVLSHAPWGLRCPPLPGSWVDR